MTDFTFTADQFDLLKEVTNRAMGKAGSDLGKLLNSFVDLSVPDISIVSSKAVAPYILSDPAVPAHEQVTTIRQAFQAEHLADGEAIVIFGRHACACVAQLMGYEGPVSGKEEVELFLEVANIIVGACMNGIAGQLFSQDLAFSPPSVISEGMVLGEFLDIMFVRRPLRWDYTLMIKIRFKLEEESFKSDLVIFLSERSIVKVGVALDAILAAL